MGEGLDVGGLVFFSEAGRHEGAGETDAARDRARKPSRGTGARLWRSGSRTVEIQLSADGSRDPMLCSIAVVSGFMKNESSGISRTLTS